MKYISLLAVLFVALTFPVSVFAHSWGTSYAAEDNGYSIDVGYSSPAPSVGESVIFDFEILKNGERFRDFSDVWVRIENNKATTLATGIHNADFGGSRLSYIFPTSGEYTVNVRFQNDDQSIAVASFPITVVGDVSSSGASNNTFNSSSLVGVAVGLVLGFVVTSLLQGKRR